MKVHGRRGVISLVLHILLNPSTLHEMLGGNRVSLELVAKVGLLP
jgi:hypothetical protein